jgi:hypothetical protein
MWYLMIDMETIHKNNPYLDGGPKYIRMPRGNGRCPMSGLSRSTLYRLAVPCHENNWRSVVRSKKLRASGSGNKGCRLIEVASLLEYLAGLPEK